MITVDDRSGRDSSGFYIRTFTGKQLYWAHVEDHDYDIKDIAHALAMKCRWSGHTCHFYSVAQHAFGVAMLVPREHRMSALLHDASEAYMPDFPSPLKWYLAAEGFTALKEIEGRVDQAICRQFSLPYPRDPCVKQADLLMLGAEDRDLMPDGQEREFMPNADMVPTVTPWLPDEAERWFLHAYEMFRRQL